MAKGALAYRPGQYDLTDQQQQKFRRLKKNKGKAAARKYLSRQDAKGNLAAVGATEETPEPEKTPEQNQYQKTHETINTGVDTMFQHMNTRPAFQPTNQTQIPGVAGGFDNSMKQYADNVYSEFERRNEPLFERQMSDFRQRMYEQGVPEGSEKYNNALEQLRQSQNDARQGAQSQATQMGMQYQQQGFGQGLAANQTQFDQQTQTYRMPFEQMAAYSPYYSSSVSSQNLADQLAYQNMSREDTQQFSTEQERQQYQYQKMLAQQAHRNALAQINATPRGGGSGYQPESFDQWKAKQDYSAGLQQQQMYDQFVLNNGASNGNAPSFGSGFGQGFGAGFGMGVGQGLGGSLS
jgi:hypothetical protein